MKYGIVASAQADEKLLRVCVTSDRDDFPDGTRIDPGDYETAWDRDLCHRGRTLPVDNASDPGDLDGVVFSNGSADLMARLRIAPPRIDRGLLLGALAVAAVGGIIAAIAFGRRR